VWVILAQTIAKSPFLRLLPAFLAGILLQYHLKIPLFICWICFFAGLLLLLLYTTLSVSKKFMYGWFNAIGIVLLFIGLGALLCFVKNGHHQSQNLVNQYQPGTTVLVALQENLVAKPKSWKADAQVLAIYKNNKWQVATGKVLVYFSKETLPRGVKIGSRLLLNKLVAIGNSGNPGSFNYARYCAMQNIYYQAFLRNQDLNLLEQKEISLLTLATQNTRQYVLKVLRNNIPNTSALAITEALLIGYKEDLDRDLVAAYSSTGVVHIIAISGMHLGMIYLLLLALCKPIKNKKLQKWVQPIVIIVVLWGFALLAGFGASVVRSAAMFSFLVLGKLLMRQNNMYNSLAASAFVLLLFNPFYLWDVGFQLSYAAVLSIVLFQQPIRRLWWLPNPILARIWNGCALTLSAQILTLPLVVYHFHQFPVLFLITNLLIVPLSGIILYGLLILICCSFWSWPAQLLGMLLSWLTQFMNQIVGYFNQMPIVVWPALQISILQACLLLLVISGLAIWLMQRHKNGLLFALSSLLAFVSIRSIDFYQKSRQQQLIIYNVPGHTAIDIMQGRSYQFLGDTALLTNGFLRNFHIQASRIKYRVSATQQTLASTKPYKNLLVLGSKKVLLVNRGFQVPAKPLSYTVDLVLITGNPRIYLGRLAEKIPCQQYVFDATNPIWKIQYWKKDADSLHLRHHYTAEKGAFVMQF
jgi:competence protein ComEC